MEQVQKFASFVNDIRSIVSEARAESASAINQAMIKAYWRIGQRIVEEEQAGYSRAEYGDKTLKIMSKELTTILGKGFGERNLAYYRKFYLDYPHSEILHTRVQNLNWSHIRALLRVDNQDVGQMDMYVRMYDELKRNEGDNPTIGILLCAETSNNIARYSVLNGSSQLFASKYLTYLPSEEELLREIDRQKEFYLLQKKGED